MARYLKASYWEKKLQVMDEEDSEKTERRFVKTRKFDYWSSNNKTVDKGRQVTNILNPEGATLLKDIAEAGKNSNGQLKLYRTMYEEEANAIIDWAGKKKSGTEGAVDEKN